jgi:glycine/D-amino acid oxidase-like deaminating enzyme
MMPSRESRIETARRRAFRAKVVVAATGALVFAASMALARANQVGHVRHTVQQLTAPRSFQAAVRSGRLQGGVVGAPEAPPSAVTASS